MPELIGATVFRPDRARLKRHLLVFDRIAWPEAPTFARLHADSPERAGEAADVQWLLDKGVMFAPDYRTESSLGPEAQEEFDQVNRRMGEGIFRSVSSYYRGEDGNKELFPVLSEASRKLAIQLRELDKLNAVPVTSSWERVSDPVTRTEVVQLVLRGIPIPGDTHSFDDVLAFRDETREQGLTQSLRVWINQMASGGLEQLEIADQLEDLVSRYDRALKLEKMQRDTGIIETLVVTTAEIAESLVKFQWSSAAKKLFEVRHKQIDLMKAEMTLPGREVADIVKARERFGPERQ
jgi:hypothetical protein